MTSITEITETAGMKMQKQKSTLRFRSCAGLIETLSFSGAIALVAIASPAQAGNLTNWRFDPATNQLEVSLTVGITPSYSRPDRPSRIVMDLPNTQLGKVATQQTYSGAVKQIRVSQLANVTRIVLDLSPGVLLKPEQVQLQQLSPVGRPGFLPSTANRWVLRLLIPSRPQAPISALPSLASTVRPTGSPTVLPPTTFPTQTTVQVPLLGRPVTATPAAPAFRPPSLQNAPGLPRPSGMLPAITPTVNVPTFQNPRRSTPALPARPPRTTTQTASRLRSTTFTPTLAAAPPIVEFGQNPETSTTPNPSLRQSGVLLASGARLNLLYPGENTLILAGDTSREEVLLLQDNLFNSSGTTLLAARDAPVVGYFRTVGGISQYIAKEVRYNGQIIPLCAQSIPLGSSKQVTTNQVLGNSVLGAIGAVVLGGFSGGLGLLAGAAVGAGATYVAAPEAIAIQPQQILPVQLTAYPSNCPATGG